MHSEVFESIDDSVVGPFDIPGHLVSHALFGLHLCVEDSELPQPVERLFHPLL
jgi:hypothetical protein